jgi:hypothetical protein
MFRATTLALAALAAIASWPVAAQERGGLRLRDPTAVLDQIDGNRGCPLSNTSVTVGVNRSLAAGSSAQQQLATLGGGSGGCRPLVSTQVAAGVNLAFGRGSSAGQSIAVQGPRGVLATNTYTRGVNYAAGARSTATQQILNLVGR